MSNAIHSEVVELVLSVEKFERQVARTGAFMDRLRQLVEKPMEIVGRFDKVINEAKMLTMSLNEAKRTQEQLNSAMIAGQIRAQEQMRKTQRENKIIVDEMIKQGVTLPGGEYRGTMSASQLSQLQRRIAEQDVTNELRKQLDLMNRQAAAEKLLVEETKRRALAQVQSSMGYRVGSTVLSGRTGALMTAAASGSFLMGASNLGAMFYMMERLSYATGIGHQNLSVFAEKLGLVKLTGDGAEASIAKFGRGLVVLGGVAAAAAAAFGTMFAGAKANKAIAEMSTLLADASVSGKEFSVMLQDATNQAVKLSGAFNTSLVDVVDGFKLALSTGINADELERFGEIALNLGKGLGASLSESISILTTFKDAFAGTVEDTVEYSDVLFNAINVGKFNVAQLNANVGRVAVTAAEAGVSFKDMMAALATLNRVGMSTSQAITSLNQMIVSIVNPTDKAKKAFDSVGIGYGAAALKGRELIDVIDEMKMKIGDNPDLWGEMFGEERGRRGAIGLAANPQLFKTNREEMEKTGTAAIAAGRAMDTFGNNIGKFWEIISSVVQAVGVDLLNAANKIFFPGGALGKDTIADIGHAMESLMYIIKNVGIFLMNVANLAIVPIRAISGLIKSVYQLSRGELSAAVSTIGDTLTSIVTSVGNGIEQFIIAIETSGDRMNALHEETKRGAKSTTDALQASSKKVVDLSGAFAGLNDSAASGARIVKTEYEKVGEVLDEVIKKAKFAKETTRIEKEADSKDFTPEAKFSMASGTYKYAMFKQARDNMLAIEKEIAEYGPGDSTQKWKRLLKEREDAQVEYTKRHIALMELLDKRREELATKERNEFIRNEQIKAGVIQDPTKTKVKPPLSPETVESVAEGLRALNDKQAELFSDTLPKISDMHESQLKARIEELKAQEIALQNAIVSIRSAGLSDVDEEAAIARIGENRKQVAKELLDAERKYRVRVDERYLSEHNNVTKLFNEKMKLYDREEKRLDKLGERLKQINEETFNKLKDMEYDRRGAGFARRDLTTQIEGRIGGLDKVPLDKFEDEIKQLNSLIERMVTFAEQDGAGGRAKRNAEEFYKAIQIATAQKERARSMDVAINDQRKEAAVRSRNVELADNPISEAIRAQAMDVVKESLAVAASHGIGINGDLAATVDVGNISANLPVGELKRAIKDAVVSEMSRYFKDKLKGNENDIDGNLTPPGGEL